MRNRDYFVVAVKSDFVFADYGAAAYRCYAEFARNALARTVDNLVFARADSVGEK